MNENLTRMFSLFGSVITPYIFILCFHLTVVVVVGRIYKSLYVFFSFSSDLIASLAYVKREKHNSVPRSFSFVLLSLILCVCFFVPSLV